MQSLFASATAFTWVVLIFLVSPAPAEGQTSAYGAVTGSVRSSTTAAGVAQATVTLTGPVGRTAVASTDASGAFLVPLVRPGEYTVRVEAIGYRPAVLLGLSVAAGEEQAVHVRLNPQPPPVFEVDTIMVVSGSSGPGGAGVTHLSGRRLDALPHRTGGVESAAALAPTFGQFVGALGLTTEETGVTVDGVPFYRAPHPTDLFEPEPLPLFPLAALEGVTASVVARDIARPGAAGGYVGLTTGSLAGERLRLAGSYSGGPLWSSSRLDDDAPTPQSFEGTISSSMPLGGDGAGMVVVGNVLRHQTPGPVRLSEGVAADLASLPSDALNPLVRPSLETLSRYAGLLRLDFDNGASGRSFVRVAGSLTSRAFSDAAPLPFHPGVLRDEESVDFSLAGGWLSSVGERTLFGIRGGVSGSFRDFKDDFEGQAPGVLMRSGSLLGGPLHASGESSRVDVTLMPTISYSLGSSSVEGGLAIRETFHTLSRSEDGSAEVVFDDPSALLSGDGYFTSLSSPEASFGTREIGAFAQYRTRLGSTVRLRLGARFDIEVVGSDRPSLATPWQAATGLANDEYPGELSQAGVEGEVTWAPGPGTTEVTVGGSVRDGDVDPRGLAETLALSTMATEVRYAGAGVAWPDGTEPAGATALPTLTLLGPGLRAPRSTTMFVGVRQSLTPSLRVLVQAAVRRTDFLMRRRNLNLPVTPAFEDPYGRAVFGTLDKDGSLVTATGDDARRFPEFGAVWALDPDGWSEYRGVTAAFEHTASAIDVFGSYTWSETTDNRVGVAQGTSETSLRPLLPGVEDEGDWSDGVSDLDTPHRVVGGLTVRAGAVEISGVYRFSSGLPFTPRYRAGVDANGDGSVRNDVAYVPAASELGALADAWPCLSDQADGFAVRNSCRGTSEHSVDARARLRVGSWGGRTVTLDVDGLNLVESSGGIVDQALLLVDPDAAIDASGSTVTIPVAVNPGFGDVLYSTSRGTMIRITLRVGT